MKKIAVPILLLLVFVPKAICGSDEMNKLNAMLFPSGSVFVPQIAVGELDPTTIFTTKLIVHNFNNFAVTARFLFFDDNAGPFTVTVDSPNVNLPVTIGSDIRVGINRQSTILLNVSKVGPLKTGWVAIVLEEQPPFGTIPRVITNAFFDVSRSGTVIASVGASAFVAKRLIMPVLVDQQTDTGVAVVNLNGPAAETTISLTLRAENGAVIGSRPLTLVSGGHTSVFVTDLFTISRTRQFLGLLEVSSPGLISALALQITGFVLTSFPVTIIDPGL